MRHGRKIQLDVSSGAVIPVLENGRPHRLPRRRADREAAAPWRCEVGEYPPERITENRTSCGEHESHDAPDAHRAGLCGHPDAEAVHGMRTGGAGGSAAPAGAHEAGARPGEENARKGGRRLERSANQRRLRAVMRCIYTREYTKERENDLHSFPRSE